VFSGSGSAFFPFVFPFFFFLPFEKACRICALFFPPILPPAPIGDGRGRPTAAGFSLLLVEAGLSTPFVTHLCRIFFPIGIFPTLIFGKNPSPANEGQFPRFFFLLGDFTGAAFGRNRVAPFSTETGFLPPLFFFWRPRSCDQDVFKKDFVPADQGPPVVVSRVMIKRFFFLVRVQRTERTPPPLSL